MHTIYSWHDVCTYWTHAFQAIKLSHTVHQGYVITPSWRLRDKLGPGVLLHTCSWWGGGGGGVGAAGFTITLFSYLVIVNRVLLHSRIL